MVRSLLPFAAPPTALARRKDYERGERVTYMYVHTLKYGIHNTRCNLFGAGAACFGI